MEFRTAAQIGEPAPPMGRAEPDPVVVDLEGDPFGACGQVDLGGTGAGVAGNVAQRLAEHGHQVVGDVVGQGVQRPGEPDGGVQPERGNLRSDDVEQAGPQAVRLRPGGLLT